MRIFLNKKKTVQIGADFAKKVYVFFDSVDKDLNNEKDLKKIAVKTSSDWNDFANYIENLGKIKSDLAYKLVVTNSSIFILETFRKQVSYYLDCTNCLFVIDLFRKLANIDISDKKSTIAVSVYSTDKNHYQFLINSSILHLFLQAAYLKSKNIPYGKHFFITTGKGDHQKRREIVSPDNTLKPYLRQINNILMAAYQKRNYSFQVAYKDDRSVVDNITPHASHKYIFKLDIHDFFPSCKREMVRKYIDFLFVNTIAKEYFEDLFLDIITYNGALAVGNPVAGILANTIISNMVKYIHNIAARHGMAFTVYADDMTLSSDRFISKKYAESLFDEAASRYGLNNGDKGMFVLNEKKSYGCSGTKREVTGLVINNNNKVTVKRSLYMKVRMSLYELSKGQTRYIESKGNLDYELNSGMINQQEYNSRVGQPRDINLQKLRGRLAWMNMCDKSGKINRLVCKYEPTLKKYQLMSDDMIMKLKSGK